MTLNRKKTELADMLFELGCIEFGEFQLKEHEQPGLPPSPVRFNLRTKDHPTEEGPLDDAGLTEIGRQLARLIKRRHLQLDRIVGLPSAGEPIAQSVAKSLNLDPDQVLRLNKTKLREGRRLIVGPVEGNFEYQDNCLMVDDVISRSRSKMEGRNVLARKGAHVNDLVVVIDRQQGGSQRMAEVGVKVHSLFTASQLMDHGLETARVRRLDYRRVLNYLHLSRQPAR